MIEALDEAGFDETNSNHLLVVLGDWNDRGIDALRTFEYLYRLTQEGKAIVTSGNHHLFLIDFLEGRANHFNYFHNGLDETIADFIHQTKPFESWCVLMGINSPMIGDFYEWSEETREEINKEYPHLLPWLKSLPRYFESQHYIGVHGAIDTEVKDWHKPHCYRYNLRDWDALEFDDGTFFGKEINNTDKTVIIGHFGAKHLRKLYNLPYNGNEILYRDDGKVISIDATTIASKKVNVLVIEDELL